MYFIPLLMSETCTLVRFRFVLYSIDVIIVLDCTLLLAPLKSGELGDVSLKLGDVSIVILKLGELSEASF